MTGPKPPTTVQRARAATGRGEWLDAYELLSGPAERGELSGPDLAFFADVAYASGRLDVTISTWERAHAEAMHAGDGCAAAAAAVRVAMHLVFDTGLMAPVRGWIKRAERLLDGDAVTPVHAWLAVVRNYERMLSGDFEAARRWAKVAVDVGSECDPAAAAVGRVAEARSLILSGEVAEGLSLLDEAAVSAASGELDPMASGVVYCEVVCALQALAQYDLAEQWTAAMEAWHVGQPVGSIHGRCRVHKAEILRLRGSLDEAEGEALRACEELRPYLRRELGWPLTELGRIRLRTGDLDGAEQSFRSAHEIGWDPFPGLALVHLARGQGPRAVQSIRDALERPLGVPSKELPPNTDLRRAPLLAAQVQIELAGGELEVARAAATELSRIATSFQSNALAAAATTARARLLLAEDDAAGARDEFDQSVRLWSAIGAPYETAEARLGLARAYRTLGKEQRAVLEFQSAASAFEGVGAARDAEGARRECASEPHRPPDDPAQDVFMREGDHWLVTFEGRSARLRDLKGLHYLARLLASPGRELHACDLAGGAGDDSAGGPILDEQARDAYRRRLTEIEEDMEEAEATSNRERLAQAEAERDFLVRELTAAVGLGGRERRTGSAAERARVAVTRAIRRAIARVGEHHSELAEHLEGFIRTGTYSAYLPNPRVRSSWKV